MKTALITGASRGIGKAIALSLAKENYNIIINYNGNKKMAEEVQMACEVLGAKVMAYQCDVTQNEDVKKMIDTVVEKFGTLDILVNNAGITEDALILRMKEESFDRVIDTNLKGCFNCIQHASKVMLKKRQGKIINMASVVGISGNAGQANYAASKAGVIALTKTTAKEFASRNITSNAIAPGFIESDMSGTLSKQVQENILKQIPLGRFGTPDDVADLVVFLASSKADYITGQVLSIDGGMNI
ncbi:MAG: 3-oxoacyl-[acyl-carrier-protein] reductase [Eubacterium sp.]